MFRESKRNPNDRRKATRDAAMDIIDKERAAHGSKTARLKAVREGVVTPSIKKQRPRPTSS